MENQEKKKIGGAIVKVPEESQKEQKPEEPQCQFLELKQKLKQ